MLDDNKPIGWWLKELDRLIEASFTEVLAEDGLSRRQWQALNAVKNGEPIATALAPFLATAGPGADPTGPEADPAAVTGPLEDRGWLEEGRLTGAGAAALERLTVKVVEHRRRITAGIDGTQYAQTVAVLRRMAANLAGSGSAV